MATGKYLSLEENDGITGEQLQADYYIDDKAIAFSTWPKALRQIK